MVVFLFFKQIADIFYQTPILDSFLFVICCILICIQIVIERPNIRQSFKYADLLMVFLLMLVAKSFGKQITGSGYVFYNILTAILLYFFGRVNYARIIECKRVLVYSSYIVIYANLIFRFLHWGSYLKKITNWSGNLYRDDTEMAYAMLTAMTFILMYEYNTFFKYLTTLFIVPLIILYSDAGIHILLMVMIYIIVIIYFSELLLDRRKLSNTLILTMVIGLMTMTLFIHLPVFCNIKDETVLSVLGGRHFNHSNMYGRYRTWRNVWNLICESGIVGFFLGNRLVYSSNIGNVYIKAMYSLGVVGVILIVLFIIHVARCVKRVNDRNTFYITVVLSLMFLTTGIVNCSIEEPQLSWMPMMYAGMVISSTGNKKVKNGEKVN